MRVLVFGAGVLGSLYAARLHRTGQDVTLLARGDRLAPDNRYDVVIVLVRKPQLAAVVPTLQANRATPTVLVMVSNAEGPAALSDAIGRGRLVLGFAGAGGTMANGVVTYQLVRGGA